MTKILTKSSSWEIINYQFNCICNYSVQLVTLRKINNVHWQTLFSLANDGTPLLIQLDDISSVNTEYKVFFLFKIPSQFIVVFIKTYDNIFWIRFVMKYQRNKWKIIIFRRYGIIVTKNEEQNHVAIKSPVQRIICRTHDASYSREIL